MGTAVILLSLADIPSLLTASLRIMLLEFALVHTYTCHGICGKFCYFIRRILGKYVEILKHIMVRDMIPFVSIYIILLFIFCGGFYFALREEVLTPSSSVSCNVSSISTALDTLNVSVADLVSAINSTASTGNVTIPFKTSLDINPEETRLDFMCALLTSLDINPEETRLDFMCACMVVSNWTAGFSEIVFFF